MGYAGSRRLIPSLSSFFDEVFHAREPVKPEHMAIAPGVGSMYATAVPLWFETSTDHGVQ